MEQIIEMAINRFSKKLGLSLQKLKALVSANVYQPLYGSTKTTLREVQIIQACGIVTSHIEMDEAAIQRFVATL